MREHVLSLMSLFQLNTKLKKVEACYLIFNQNGGHTFFKSLQSKKLCALVKLQSRLLFIFLSAKDFKVIGLLVREVSFLPLLRETYEFRPLVGMLHELICQNCVCLHSICSSTSSKIWQDMHVELIRKALVELPSFRSFACQFFFVFFACNH